MLCEFLNGEASTLPATTAKHLKEYRTINETRLPWACLFYINVTVSNNYVAIRRDACEQMITITSCHVRRM